MKSHGKFQLEVKVPPGEDVQQKANDIIMLMREEVSDPADFLPNLEKICQDTADFLRCRLVMEEKDGILIARFIFK